MSPVADRLGSSYATLTGSPALPYPGEKLFLVRAHLGE